MHDLVAYSHGLARLHEEHARYIAHSSSDVILRHQELWGLLEGARFIQIIWIHPMMFAEGLEVGFWAHEYMCGSNESDSVYEKRIRIAM